MTHVALQPNFVAWGNHNLLRNHIVWSNHLVWGNRVVRGNSIDRNANGPAANSCRVAELCA